jgi:hypothetical protein
MNSKIAARFLLALVLAELRYRSMLSPRFPTWAKVLMDTSRTAKSIAKSGVARLPRVLQSADVALPQMKSEI